MKQRISRSWVNCPLVCQSVGRSVNEAFNLSDIQLLSQSESQLVNQPSRWNLTNPIIQQPANRREQQMYWIVFNQWINRSSSSLSPVRSIDQLAFVKEQITKKEKKKEEKTKHYLGNVTFHMHFDKVCKVIYTDEKL